jgi:hypothetical protein
MTAGEFALFGVTWVLVRFFGQLAWLAGRDTARFIRVWRLARHGWKVGARERRPEDLKEGDLL